MTIFEVVWTDYKLENEYIIGRLAHDEHWVFKYNQNQIYEAIRAGFRPFIELSNINETYFSEKLFPTFAIRLPNDEVGEEESYLTDGATLATDRIRVYRRGVNKSEEN